MSPESLTRGPVREVEKDVVSPAVRTAMQRRMARKSRYNRFSKFKQQQGSEAGTAADSNTSFKQATRGGHVEFPKSQRSAKRGKDPTRTCSSASPQIGKVDESRNNTLVDGVSTFHTSGQRRQTNSYRRKNPREAAFKGD